MMINRYRINMMEHVNGRGWVKIPTDRQNSYHIDKRVHGRGGWCRWEDVKVLIDRIEELEDAQNTNRIIKNVRTILREGASNE